MKKQFLKAKPLVKVTFSLTQEEIDGGKEVLILGDFNNWDPEMAIGLKKQKSGAFSATLELDTNQEFQFKYLIDKSKWLNDAAADAYVPGPFGDPNSVISTKH